MLLYGRRNLSLEINWTPWRSGLILRNTILRLYEEGNSKNDNLFRGNGIYFSAYEDHGRRIGETGKAGKILKTLKKNDDENESRSQHLPTILLLQPATTSHQVSKNSPRDIKIMRPSRYLDCILETSCHIWIINARPRLSLPDRDMPFAFQLIHAVIVGQLYWLTDKPEWYSRQDIST